MTDFFRAQMDYIYFFYGLSFLFLVPTSYFLSRGPQRRLPWVWLGLFAAAHGLNEWMDLLIFYLGRGPILGLAQFGLVATSYIFLMEFGRAGTVTVRGRGPGRWILAVFLGVGLLGGMAGMTGISATIRYALGLVGGLWAAYVLHIAAETSGPGRLPLRGAALGIAAYALASGLVVRPAPFFPASWLNTTSFLAATGVPIQLVRGLLAFWIAACLTPYSLISLAQATERRLRVLSRTLIFISLGVIIVLVKVGWFTTEYFGNQALQKMKTERQYHANLQTLTIANSMNEADNLANTMATLPWMTTALEDRDVKAMERANDILDRYSYLLPGAMAYLMDRNGLIIASSNRHQADSAVGKSYESRPYFQQALQGEPGRYWALGVTSREMGYYASYPVRGRAGPIVGVAVIKRPFHGVEEFFPPETAGFVIDSQGIVVLANRPEMVLKSLWPLSPGTREYLLASRQFGPGPFIPILTREPVDRGEAWFQGERQLVLRQPFPWDDWSTVILSPWRPILLGRLLGISLTMVVFLALIGFLTVMGGTIEGTARIQNSERRYRGLYESLRDGSASVNLEGKITEWNPEFQNMLGYTAAELCQLTYRDITPEQWHSVEARIIENQVFIRGYSDLFEKEYRRKDGTVFPVELQTYLLRDNLGHPAGMWALVRDITERRRAEEALSKNHQELQESAQRLEQSRNMLQLIIESIPVRVFWKDWDSRYLGCNTLFARDAGFSHSQELLGKDDFAMGWREQADLYRTDDRQVMESRRPKLNIPEPQTTPEGVNIWLNTSKVPLFRPDGEVFGVLGVYEDITVRKQAEAELKLKEQMLDGASDSIFLHDMNGNFIYVNEAAYTSRGYAKEELLEKNLMALVAGDVAQIRERLLEAWQQKNEIIFESQQLRKDGSVMEAEVHARLIDVDGRRLILSVARDITQRKRAEEAFQFLVKYAPMGIYIVQKGKFVMLNPGFEAISGYRAQELLGQHCLGLVSPAYKAIVREKALRKLQGEELPPYEYQFIAKNGDLGWVMETVTHTEYNGKNAVLGYFMDITPLKKLEAQFLQAQKMEAVGRLAGGVAHDFNNLLGIILGHTEIMLLRLQPNDPLYSHVEEIKNAGVRASNLIRQLLAFSRKQIMQPQVLNLNDVVDILEKMLHRIIGEDIELVTILASNLAPVKADPGQIEQIILNLAVNAKDVMPQGGKLTIETGGAYLDETYCLSHPDASPGPYVMLAVSDNGLGMDEDTLAHIFEPFYTTKEIDKGTGLGLSTVHGIVKQSGGSIEVYSEPGFGTTFKIYLPRVGIPEASLQAESDTGSLQGHETILLVEDDNMLRPLIIDMLKMYGYEILEAKNGDEALLVCERHAGPIHLLVTDVVMPCMNGQQLAQRAASLRPKMKVLFMSGYPENVIVHHGVFDGDTSYIQKPFLPDTLAKKVREVLEATAKPLS